MPGYDNAIALAQRLIAKRGESVTLVGYAATPTDPAKPWEAPGTPATRSVKGVFLPIGASTPALAYQNGSTSKVGDLRVYIASVDSTGNAIPSIDLGSTITRGNGSVWTVANCTPLDPGGETVLYDLWVTR